MVSTRHTQMPRGEHCLIVGGGICGLGAANEALDAGLRVTLIEADREVGGLLTTDRHQGFSFDRGGHRFITAIPWILERVTELLGERLLLRERSSFVLLDGRRLHYPLRLDDLLRQLGPLQNLSAIASYLFARVRQFARFAPAGNPTAESGTAGAVTDSNSSDNLEAWIRRNFGDYLYRRVFEGYSEKLWGVHPRQISAEWAPKRISIPTLGGYLREMLFPSRRPARTYASRYLYPKTGIGEIPEALAARVLDKGARIITHTRLRALRRDRGRWIADAETALGLERIEADSVISTIPIGTLHDVWEGPSPPPAATLRFRGLRFLNLAYDEPVPLDATWIYNPKRDCRFTRVQIPAARSPWMVPAGCGSIQLEEPFDPRTPQHTGSMPEAGRLDSAQALIGELGMALPPPQFVFETCATHAYPVYEPVMKQRARQLQNWFNRQPNLRSVGRQGGFSYVFLDKAWAEGVNAARHIAGLTPLELPQPKGNAPITLESRSLVEDTRVEDTRAEDVPGTATTSTLSTGGIDA